MKLVSLIDEKYGLSSNPGREFGERFIRDFIEPGKFAELWTAFEATYPKLKPKLQATFAKTNDLFGYIKPELGSETYRVSSIDEPVAQELGEYLDNIVGATDELANLGEIPDVKTVSDAIQYFDGLLQDMLNLFTSNTAGDKPLKPYKQTDIGFGSSQYNEGFWDSAKSVAKAILPTVPGSVKRAAKNISRSPLAPRLTKDYERGKRVSDDEKQWNDWSVKSFGGEYSKNKKAAENALIKHGVSKEKVGKMAFWTYEDILSNVPNFSLAYTKYPYKKKDVDEIIREIIKSTLLEMDYKLPGEAEAEKLAIKTKQVVKKTGEELGNLAKDIYDTPTIKRLRAYIKSELEKLTAKYGVDGTSKHAPKSTPKNEHYYVDAMSDDEDYCPVCAAKMNEAIKREIAECWKTHKQVGTKKKGGKTVPNCVPKNEEVDEAKTKPAKGKRFAKKVKNPKTGRTRTVSYGQAGKAKKGGDRIRPGTAKGNAYCA